mgnify:CR=1 FL=1|jgi:hypothetical protein
MAAKWSSTKSHTPVTGARGKKTSIGNNNLATSTMNKNYRRSFKKYRGQGK